MPINSILLEPFQCQFLNVSFYRVSQFLESKFIKKQDKKLNIFKLSAKILTARRHVPSDIQLTLKSKWLWDDISWSYSTSSLRIAFAILIGITLSPSNPIWNSHLTLLFLSFFEKKTFLLSLIDDFPDDD